MLEAVGWEEGIYRNISIDTVEGEMGRKTDRLWKYLTVETFRFLKWIQNEWNLQTKARRCPGLSIASSVGMCSASHVKALIELLKQIGKRQIEQYEVSQQHHVTIQRIMESVSETRILVIVGLTCRTQIGQCREKCCKFATVASKHTCSLPNFLTEHRVSSILSYVRTGP